MKFSKNCDLHSPITKFSFDFFTDRFFALNAFLSEVVSVFDRDGSLFWLFFFFTYE